MLECTREKKGEGEWNCIVKRKALKRATYDYIPLRCPAKRFSFFLNENNILIFCIAEWGALSEGSP
jgi:hypothetical protein